MSALDLAEDNRSFDIFIGGPMGDVSDDGAGHSLSDHLPNLAAAIDRILDEIDSERRAKGLFCHSYTVRTPPTALVGDIIEPIFDIIDEADLGILDLSGPIHRLETGSVLVERPSANVIYEMALLHSLGARTLPVALKSAGGQAMRLPFYFNQTHCAVVDDFSVEALIAGLKERVRKTLYPKPGQAGLDTLNPISKYYDGLALIDISSANGLATGYFNNFIKLVLDPKHEFFERNVGGVLRKADFDKLVIVAPDSLSALRGLSSQVLGAIDDAGLKREPISKALRPDRNFNFHASGRFLLDFPVPLLAMVDSPRYRKISGWAARATGPDAMVLAARLRKRESSIIASFFASLRYAMVEHKVYEDRVLILSPAELLERLRLASG